MSSGPMALSLDEINKMPQLTEYHENKGDILESMWFKSHLTGL